MCVCFLHLYVAYACAYIIYNTLLGIIIYGCPGPCVRYIYIITIIIIIVIIITVSLLLLLLLLLLVYYLLLLLFVCFLKLICLFICLFIYLFVCLCVCLFICKIYLVYLFTVCIYCAPLQAPQLIDAAHGHMDHHWALEGHPMVMWCLLPGMVKEGENLYILYYHVLPNFLGIMIIHGREKPVQLVHWDGVGSFMGEMFMKCWGNNMSRK